MTVNGGCSKPVTSSQEGPHPNLVELVNRHRRHAYQKPVADHGRAAFDEVAHQVSPLNTPLILDSGCGTGESTHALARSYPDHFIIGVDKSVHRLSKEGRARLPENAALIRADLTDFYRLAAAEGWQLSRHFILYPNPWPKPGHLMRRWHGSPVFPDMIALGGRIELRTNWKTYAEEFRIALAEYDIPSTLERLEPQGDHLTLFERKYASSGQVLYCVAAIAGSRQSSLGRSPYTA
ncbi:MAG: methyltransferase domain-containing protein [Pseudomonadota bacterium]